MARKAKDAEADKGKTKARTKRRGVQRLMESGTVAAIQKTFGNSIKVGSEAPPSVRISSGVAPLDFHLGGGWTKGYFHTLYGKKSCGKTTTLLRAYGMAQLTCRVCNTLTILDPEKCVCGKAKFEPHVVAHIRLEEWDTEWAARFCNIDEIALVEPNYAEEALDIAEALVLSGEVDVIGIDSLAFLTPKREIEDSVAKENQALQSRALGRGIRKLNAALARQARDSGHRPTVFMTNQVRMKIGVMFGSPETTPGGFAPQFASGTEVRMSYAEYKQPKDGDRAPIYVDLHYRIEKNKTSTAKMEGSYRMMTSDGEHKKLGDVLDEEWLLSKCEQVGLLTGAGAAYTIFDTRYAGKKPIIEKMYTDRTFYFEVRDTLFEVLRQMKASDPDGTEAVVEEDPALEIGADD